jgi:hypothetical protein
MSFARFGGGAYHDGGIMQGNKSLTQSPQSRLRLAEFLKSIAERAVTLLRGEFLV